MDTTNTKISAEEAKKVSGKLDELAQDIKIRLNNLKSTVESVEGNLEGKAATNLIKKYESIDKTMKSYEKSLKTLAFNLNKSGEIFTALDEAYGNALNGKGAK